MHAVADLPQTIPDARLARPSQTFSCRMRSGSCLKDKAMIRKSLLAAVTLCGLALSASQPACAGTRIVSYTDLDLSTQEGQAKLDARIRAAAKQVCNLHHRDLSAADAEAGRACFARAMADARRDRANIKPTALVTR
jgi:UrcA family protein